MDPSLAMLLQTMQKNQEEFRLEVRENFKDVKDDIDALKGFRWKVAGIATACSAIMGLILKVYFN